MSEETKNIGNELDKESFADDSVHVIPYAQIPRHLIQKSGLSINARMLLIYLLSFKQGWVFYDSKVMVDLGIKLGILKKAHRELRLAGYERLERFRQADGTVIGSRRIFASEPIFKPKCDKGSTESAFYGLSVKPTVGETTGNNNTNSCNNINPNNTHTREVQAHEPPPDTINHNADVCVVLNEWGFNETQIDYLTTRFGWDDVREKIELTLSAPRDSNAAFLKAALKGNYQPKNQSTAPRKATTPNQRSSPPEKKPQRTKFEKGQAFKNLNTEQREYLFKLCYERSELLFDYEGVTLDVFMSDDYVNNKTYMIAINLLDEIFGGLAKGVHSGVMSIFDENEHL